MGDLVLIAPSTLQTLLGEVKGQHCKLEHTHAMKTEDTPTSRNNEPFWLLTENKQY